MRQVSSQIGSAFALVALLIFGLVMGACSSAQKPDQSEYTNGAHYAYDFADFQFQKKDWDYARSLFEEVKQQYPYSLYAVKAELRVADTHYQEKSFIRAAASYRRFIQLHPSHEDVDYAAYRIVKSYSELMPGGAFFMPPTWERDRRDARNAYQAARQFLRSYSSSEYVDDVEELQQIAVDRLAHYELYVAQYYMHPRRHRSPIASVRRVDSLLEQYPESSLIPEALDLQVEAALAMDDMEQAQESLARLQQNYPDAEETSEAQARINDYEPPTEASESAEDS
jgi:outer membrane protein assembly factor BamD